MGMLVWKNPDGSILIEQRTANKSPLQEQDSRAPTRQVKGLLMTGPFRKTGN